MAERGAHPHLPAGVSHPPLHDSSASELRSTMPLATASRFQAAYDVPGTPRPVDANFAGVNVRGVPRYRSPNRGADACWARGPLVLDPSRMPLGTRMSNPYRH